VIRIGYSLSKFKTVSYLEKYKTLAKADAVAIQLAKDEEYNNIGSNNWVVTGNIPKVVIQ